jgi:phosphatidate cytidylyltransferase
VASGLVLAAVAFALLWAGPVPFAALVLAVALVMSWEWGRVVRQSGVDVVLVVHAVAVVACVGLAVGGYAALGLLAVLAGAIIVGALRFGEHAYVSSFGVLYTGLPSVALLWLRGDGAHGFQAVLLLLLLVSVTDIFAYFAGRLFDGARLWPSVSPNKTWAGLLGGLAASVAAGAAFSTLVAGAAPVVLATTGLFVGLVAQAGDLAESALKRRFGVKDASTLIPGHGGFMDRMDGLVAASIAAAILAGAINAHAPARAFLFWS